MVRLKANTLESWILPFAFQFHYGTIKSQISSHIAFYKNHFNSTMVRLKDRRFVWLLIRIIYFNSTMVRLKVARRW